MRDRLKFVAVVKGFCWIETPGRGRRRLSSGDVCLIGRTEFTVAGDPDPPAADGVSFMEEAARDSLRLGGDDTVVLGGGIALTRENAGFLLDMLPEFAVAPRAPAGAASVMETLALLDAEMTRAEIGSGASPSASPRSWWWRRSALAREAGRRRAGWPRSPIRVSAACSLWSMAISRNLGQWRASFSRAHPSSDCLGRIRGTFVFSAIARQGYADNRAGFKQGSFMALELRPNCEWCDKDLPPASTLARICSYECTFCADCVERTLHNVCPNCGGGFAPRPIRPAIEWRRGLSVEKRPPSNRRVHLSFTLEDIAAHTTRIKDIAPENR